MAKKMKASEVVETAVNGAGLGLAASGAGSAIVAAAPVIAAKTTVFAGIPFLAHVGGTTASAVAVALAAHPVGWAVLGAVGLVGLVGAVKKLAD